MILGKIVGKVSTTKFEFNVTSSDAKKFQFLQVNHPQYSFVLCQIMELIREKDRMLAKCSIIGYKDGNNRLSGIRTPFNIGTEVLEAETSFIKKIIELDEESKQNSAYIGKLEGKDIKVFVNLQKILTRHLAILAKSGAGKSYTVGVLLEEIIERGVPLLIIDPHGEYSSLKYPSKDQSIDLAKWDVKATGYKQKIQVFGDLEIDPSFIPIKLSENMSCYELMKLLPLSLSNTQESILFSAIKDLDPRELNFQNIIFNLQQINNANIWSIVDTINYLKELNLFSNSPTALNEIVQSQKCSIINLKGMDPSIQGMLVAKLLKDLFTARKKGKIPPFFCIIEEAHNFVPEKGFGNSKSSEIIRLISSEGRKFGLGLAVISQRPALVQKTVLAQCSTQIIMKITNPNDLRVITSSAEGIGSETTEEIQNLPIGSALICGIVDRPLVVNIRRRKSLHGGEAVDVLADSNHDLDSNYRSTNIPNKSQINAKKTNNENINSQKENEPGKNKPEENKPESFINQIKDFEEQNLVSIIPSKLSIKDIKLSATKEIEEIKTYLIPALFCKIVFKNHRQFSDQEFSILIDKIKGKIILDPETDTKIDIKDLNESSAFYRKPEYKSISNHIKIPEKLTNVQIQTLLKNHHPNIEIIDFFDSNILFYKVEFSS